MSAQRTHGIAWTEQTWNPVRGCSRVSEGCRNCYAEKVAARFSGPGLPYEGLARRITIETTPEHGYLRSVARWTGKVVLVPEHLTDPLRWKRPRRVFVNSMSDLFHEALSNEQIAAVFGIMAAAPRHTFQVLTKRAQRMRDWLRWVEAQRPALSAELVKAGGAWPGSRGQSAESALCCYHARHELERLGDKVPLPLWPLANVWLGVSVEDQKTADERIPMLLETPAAVRWVSYEPALGPVDFTRWLPDPEWFSILNASGVAPYPRLNWIVVGGESGADARPFDLAWARDTIQACRGAGVAPFFKQAGSRPILTRLPNWEEDGWGNCNLRLTARDGVFRIDFDDRKGGDPAEWPAGLRVREYPA